MREKWIRKGAWIGAALVLLLAASVYVLNMYKKLHLEGTAQYGPSEVIGWRIGRYSTSTRTGTRFEGLRDYFHDSAKMSFETRIEGLKARSVPPPRWKTGTLILTASGRTFPNGLHSGASEYAWDPLTSEWYFVDPWPSLSQLTDQTPKYLPAPSDP